MAIRPMLLLTLPVVAVMGYLAAGGLGIVLATACLTAVLAIIPEQVAAPRHGDPVTGLPLRPDLEAAVDGALEKSRREHRNLGVIVVEIDRFKNLVERYDHRLIDALLQTVADRLRGELRDADVLARLDGPSFGIALSPARRLDLEAAIQLIGRLQQAVAEPIPNQGANIYLTISAGFALAERVEKPTGPRLVQAATSALIEAQRAGDGSIRSYSTALKNRIATRTILASDLAAAMDEGQIVPFFQPQVHATTREVSGFEVLARWIHPERGMIPPGEFLPALEEAGLMERLGEIMVHEGLRALRYWDSQGFEVPHVGVNFATSELLDPKLIDRINFELDRFEISPERLVVEVLETVVADQSSDTVVRNLAGLARLGCCLDLDDFGTGHASITNIRRFSIKRIKIDRSFVTNVDKDPDQQQMLAAIVMMAQNLGVDTLAEGVETEDELATLVELGCNFVQGFHIARPMPLEEANAWLEQHFADRSGRDRTVVSL